MKYKEVKRECPRCQLKWNDDLAASKAVESLKKVDFFWINRDQKSFEWFLHLLNQMETEQALEEEANEYYTEGLKERQRFLDIHMYFTAALQRTDMRAVGLQVALDLLHKKVRPMENLKLNFQRTMLHNLFCYYEWMQDYIYVM